MARIVPISYKKFDRFLHFSGCTMISQSCSHRKYNRSGLSRPIIVPIHASIDIPVFVIKNALHTLGISNEEYLDILGRI